MDEDPKEKAGEERPLECTGCQKPISVRYTEVTGQQVTHTIMCADCPQLEQRLHGIPAKEQVEKLVSTGLCCGNCGTTLNDVRSGGVLGCNMCYEVFDDVIIAELDTAKKLPVSGLKIKKRSPIHIGRELGETKKMGPSEKLMALNEALNETLHREDYEEAALLRDQIKEITENPDAN